MTKLPLNVDLARLRQFLAALETEAQITVGDVDLAGYEIEELKREIAHIEGVLNGSPDHGTRAILFQIAIDYGAPHDLNARTNETSAAMVKAA